MRGHLRTVRPLGLLALQALGILLFQASAGWPAQTVQATVTRVIAGNTAVAEDTNSATLRCHLAGIDTPDVGRPRQDGGTNIGALRRMNRLEDRRA